MWLEQPFVEVIEYGRCPGIRRQCPHVFNARLSKPVRTRAAIGSDWFQGVFLPGPHFGAKAEEGRFGAVSLS